MHTNSTNMSASVGLHTSFDKSLKCDTMVSNSYMSNLSPLREALLHYLLGSR